MQNVIYAYTRKQALADGEQVDVSTIAAKAGIRFPVFFTRAVYDAHVSESPEFTGQNKSWRLRDILADLRFAIIANHAEGDRVPLLLAVENKDHSKEIVELIAICGAMDIDDPQPTITVMLPDED